MEKHKSLTQWMDYFIDDVFPCITQEESDMIRDILCWDDERRSGFMFAKKIFEEGKMDKQIRKIEKETKKVEKDLSHLEKADKKRDKFVDAGKKAMKKK